MIANLTTDKKQWDTFVDSSPSGLLFHRWDFLKTIRNIRAINYFHMEYTMERNSCAFSLFSIRTTTA